MRRQAGPSEARRPGGAMGGIDGRPGGVWGGGGGVFEVLCCGSVTWCAIGKVRDGEVHIR